MTNLHDLPRPGDQFHVLVSGFSIHTKAHGFSGSTAILDRGATVTITQDILDAAVDRFGNPGWPATLHDPEAQTERWGEQMIAPGPWPADAEPWIYGDRRWETDRDMARRAAWAIADERERATALAAVETRFGPARSTSQTTAVYRPGQHPTERAASQQERAFAAARARGER